jgi:SPP1 family predicted phage head-tail adaptor
MRAGDLRHRITILIPAIATNAIGEWINTYEAWCVCWAEILPDTGSTTYSAKQFNAEASGRIRIRYRTGIKPTMRISYQGHIYQILSIIEPKIAHEDIVIIYKEALD